MVKAGQYEFRIKEDLEGKLVFLGSEGDPSDMNWVQGNRDWGTVVCPDTLKVKVEREIRKNGRMRETYKFTNTTTFPVFLKKQTLESMLRLMIIMSRLQNVWREGAIHIFSVERRLFIFKLSVWEDVRRI